MPDLDSRKPVGAEAPAESERDAQWSPGAGVASLVLAGEATNLLVVRTDGGVACHTDPHVSLKIVDQMLRLGWSEM